MLKLDVISNFLPILTFLQKAKTPRKFGTDLTRSSVGNITQPPVRLSSRSAKKSTTKKGRKPFTPLSAHDENFKSPEEVKSRLHSKRNMTIRNLELEGSLRRAEESVQSAMAQKIPEEYAIGHTLVTKRNLNQSGIVSHNTPMSQSEKNGVGSIDSKNRSKSFSSSSSRRFSSASPSTSMQYTIPFEAGSIGLKVEPVIKNGNKEFGCRVMRFLDGESQAKQFPQIEVGHVLTSVNGRNVTAKSYAEIVALLAEYKSEQKKITFRIPRSSPSIVSTPSSTFTLKSQSQFAEVPLSKHQIKMSPGSSPYVSATPPTLFSPSFVKKMSRTTIQDHPIFPSPAKQSVKTVTDVLNNVMKNIVPEDTGSKPSFSTGALSKKISEALVGQHSVQFDETVQMKMELLTELSEAKASLGEHEMSIKKMEDMVDTLTKEKKTILNEKEVAEATLTGIQKEKVSSSG